uniref:Polyphenoloxidase n=1 Tax=Suaeda salsa TaxID=126914 RepID=L7UVM0_SUASA|nr:polyphenoloxidase [Suaeda salsa]
MASLAPSPPREAFLLSLLTHCREPSQLSAFHSNKTRRAIPKISCNASKNDSKHQTPKTTDAKTSKFDRRNMLIGLGGLYGAATTLGGGPAAIAKPTSPDVTQCGLASVEDKGKSMTLDCCPPKPSQFVDFKLPKSYGHNLKIRPAAHLVDKTYIEKYNKALSLMKALPDSDPRSFAQQAKVHCAYCNGGYHQAGLPDLDFQVHGSWLFFPFHRAYLYFYERILGSLINDPTFAIPYWNWDHPDGMVMPTFFNDQNSPFFDVNRDQNHLPPTVMDHTYDGPAKEHHMPYDEQIKQNLTIMYKAMVANAKTPEMFLGAPYRQGDPPGTQPGSLEVQPHGTIHNWVGNPKPNTPFWEDMGNFYSAGRDPIFYAHHANVDRTWSIWKTLSPKNKDFKDKDFLNSYFYFFDENAQPVRISVRDCLSSRKMGYDYQPMDLPWLRSRPNPFGRVRKAPRRILNKVFSGVKNAVAADNPPVTSFPQPLNKVIWTNIPRPIKLRSKKEKEDEEEVLIIEVESKGDVYSKFDVYVNDEDETPSKENRSQTEYAGSFVNVPHKHRHGDAGNVMSTTVKFGLTDLMEDLGADDDEGIDVTFVPRTGTESVVIKDVRIEFLN